MKRIFQLLILLIPFTSLAQNMVPNGSFEEKTACPWNYTQYNYVKSWYYLDHLGTPDYFDTCAIDSSCTVPGNYLGYEWPADGGAYTGITLYRQNYGNFREYLAVELKNPMLAGVEYVVALKTSLSEYCRYSTGKLGIHFSDSVFSARIKTKKIYVTPQLTVNSKLNQYQGWEQHHWNYTAKGGESFMIIGNFEDDWNTPLDTVVVPFPNKQAYAYVFIDQVKVDSSFCDFDTSLSQNAWELISNDTNALYQWVECVDTGYIPIAGADSQSFHVKKSGEYAVILKREFCRDTSACVYFTASGIDKDQRQSHLVIFPNPATDVISVLNLDREREFSLFDPFGRSVRYGRLSPTNNQLDVLNLSPGLYFLRLDTMVFKVLIE